MDQKWVVRKKYLMLHMHDSTGRLSVVNDSRVFGNQVIGLKTSATKARRHQGFTKRL
jgi:hypothetical protein